MTVTLVFSRLPKGPARGLAACFVLGGLAAGCQTSVGGGSGSGATDCPGPRSSTVISERLTTSRIERVDLLLDIDNSPSMADKQTILALAVPDLVGSLVNPPCVQTSTGEVVLTPDGPLSACPAGTRRKMDPVLDLHVGVISSSLGGHGSGTCDPTAGNGNPSLDDRARLLNRADPNTYDMVETYQNLHFLAWDPAQKLTPPGEADIAQDSGADTNTTALVPQLRDLVLGVGQMGCGYESQLEAWYRFLVDPSPPANLIVQDGVVVPEGVDALLLDQRKAFLRPDSLVEIVMLTDENDCSIRESGQYYLAAQIEAPNGQLFHLPRARAVCDASPNDECCFSCGQTGPKNPDGTAKCPADPTCVAPDGSVATVDPQDDGINLRCYNQKRRFGIDFLNGTDRYVQGLESPTVTNRDGVVVPNPLFSDLDPTDSDFNVRTPDMVLLAGIVGVPWQDIARLDANGAPDLMSGLDAQGQSRGGFKSALEMAQPLPGKDYSAWDMVLGSPADYPAAAAMPKDPLMIESIDARAGVSPVTGEPLAPPSSPLGNAINGNERTIANRNDLQYACIFPMVTVDAVTGNVVPLARDCSQGAFPGCDCAGGSADNPLCEVDPSTGQPTLQVRAKAYPGLRELQVLKDLGAQGIVGSVCPGQLANGADPDFGYRPALAGLTDRLAAGALDGQCLSRSLTANEDGQVPCLAVEARHVGAAEAAACNACNVPGRAPIGPAQQQEVADMKAQNPAAAYDCFCNIRQLSGSAMGEDLWACQFDPSPAPVASSGQAADGFCYVDASEAVGNPNIVEHCPAEEKRMLRFVGAGQPLSGSTLFMTCVTDQPYPPDGTCSSAP